MRELPRSLRLTLPHCAPPPLIFPATGSSLHRSQSLLPMRHLSAGTPPPMVVLAIVIWRKGREEYDEWTPYIIVNWDEFKGPDLGRPVVDNRKKIGP